MSRILSEHKSLPSKKEIVFHDSKGDGRPDDREVGMSGGFAVDPTNKILFIRIC